MILIPLLGTSSIARVDDIDSGRIKPYQWTRLETKNSRYYAKATIKGEQVLLHRFLMEAPANMLVDHVDGDGLNCLRVNMRLCTRTENNRNKSPVGLYKGVKYQKGRWYARIMFQGREISLGGHSSMEEAARAYDLAAKRLFGDFARLNFPEQECYTFLQPNSAEAVGSSAGS